MRTTVTLDPDTERLLRDAVAARRLSFKRVLNEAIRAGLGAAPDRRGTTRPEIPVFRSGYAPGLDRTRLQQLSDAMETEGFATKRRRS